MENNQKSPLGLIPLRYDKNVQVRANDILLAMHRYVECNKAIPSEWFEELKFLQGGASDEIG